MKPRGLGDGLSQCFGIADRFRPAKFVGHARHDLDHVARNLDVHGALVARGRFQHAVDLAKRGHRIDQLRRGDAQFFEHFELRAKVAHLVMQERIIGPLAHTRRAGDQHHRRFLGVRTRDAVGDAQSADAVGHAYRPHTVDARVRVGGKAGVVLATAADEIDRAVFEHRIECQHVIAGNAEYVADAIVLQTVNQELADRKLIDWLALQVPTR